MAPATVRHAVHDDFPGLLDVARASLDSERGTADQLIQYLWDQGTARSTQRLVAHVRGDAVGVLFGSQHNSTAHIDLLCVAPIARRNGVGRALVQTWESLAAQNHAADLFVGGNPEMYAWPGIDMRYTPAISLFLRRGYIHHETRYQMEVDLTGDRRPTSDTPPTLARAGLRVRRTEVGDREAVTAYLRSTWGGTWAEEVQTALDAVPSRVFIALQADEIVGFAAHGIGWPARYGPIGTSASVRGLGIGDALSRSCLDDMARAGIPIADIAWAAESAVPFYSNTVAARLSRCFWSLRRTVAHEGDHR